MLFFQRIEKWASQKSESFWIGITLCVALLMRIGFLLEPSRPWWDATVYQGMGRFIASGGLYGAWEFFRPPLWPIILSVFSWTGPYIMEWIAKIITVIVSLAAIYCVYRLAKPISYRAGMLAATLLSLSVPFLAFSTIPMTEVLSTCLVALSAVMFVRGKWFFAGLIAGSAFMARFPAGLIVPALGVAILLSTSFSEGFYKYVYQIFKRGLLTGLGFVIIAIPYFVSNLLLYGGLTDPLVAGSGMITGFLWLYQGDMFFYIKNMVTMNPVSILVVVAIGLSLFKWKNINETGKRSIIISLVATTFFIGYFSLQAHKEFRYSMPAFPFIFALAGIGFAWLTENWNKRLQVVASLFLALIAFLFSITYRHDAPKRIDAVKYREFYSALKHVKPGTRVISSTPAIAAFSPVLLVEGYNTWAQMTSSYNEAKDLEYVAIDSCELHACEPGKELLCKADQDAFINRLSSEGELVYDSAISSCKLMIYKLHISR